MVSATYFEAPDGTWFEPTDFCRGPWDPRACHAGPPLGLMIRAIEHLDLDQRLSRITVEIRRPIPMAGFSIVAAIQRRGRAVTTTEAEIRDGENRLIAQTRALHIRVREEFDCTTAPVDAPLLENALPGPFPITDTRHGLTAFSDSLEVRYDPGGSQGTGGPTTLWMRSLPLLPGEQPSGFQRITPLVDSGNGITFNDYLDQVLFINPDLTAAFHREPQGEWLCSRARSHWQPDGIGLSTAELFDTAGHIGIAIQTLKLDPA